MPLVPLAVPAFPDVPRAPGVPAVLRLAGAVQNALVLLVADAVIIARMFAGPQWGIWDQSGRPLVIGDSVAGVDFRQEWRVSDYPIERGSFASYDKVAVPFDIRVTFSVSGAGADFFGAGLAALVTGASPGVANRTAALAVLRAAAESLDLFSVVTPEFRYDNCNIVHYDYRREARGGATLIKVDVWLVQIRIAPAPQFTQTKPESAADRVNGGAVQPATPPPGAPATVADSTNALGADNFFGS
jgi:hypothetical protein